MKKSYSLILSVVIIFLSSSLFGQNVQPDKALQMLKDGNKRYLSGKFNAKDFSNERIEQSKEQKPYAIILTCADSRLSPELLFDESLGKLFVIRVAGNITDPAILGSIEYAAEHLHAGLVVIMGHSSCGAVKATIDGGKLPPNIADIAKRIEPAVAKVKEKNITDKDKMMNAAIEENVTLQLNNCFHDSEIITEMEHEKKLKVIGAVYNLTTGEVKFIEHEAHH